jgi:hypothetical protein
MMKAKTRFFLILVLGLFTIACGSNPNKNNDSLIPPDLPKINIPNRDHGYSNLQNTVINSSVELNKYIQSIKQQSEWINKTAFVSALQNAEVDFDKQNILIYIHTEGSGSVEVTLENPVWEKENAIIHITRTVPEISTGDMAYYAYAFKVSKTIPKVIFSTIYTRIEIANNVSRPILD